MAGHGANGPREFRRRPTLYVHQCVDFGSVEQTIDPHATHTHALQPIATKYLILHDVAFRSCYEENRAAP